MKKVTVTLLTASFVCFLSCFLEADKEKRDSSFSKKSEENNTLSSPLMNNKLISIADSTIDRFTDLQADAFKLHYDAVVVDTHNDVFMPVKLQGAEIILNNPGTQSDLVKWRKGGLDVQVFSIYVPEKFKTGHFNYAMGLIDILEMTAAENSGLLGIASDYRNLTQCISEHRFCCLMGVEGGNIIEGSMDNLITLHSRGVRYLGLTWNTSNEIAVSARDETTRGKSGGLTEFGAEVVKKMDELGMLIDVSHLGETAFWDVVKLSKNPVIASHSNVYNLCPHYRNLKDDQIKAIASSGGYIGINFYSKFLEPNADEYGANKVQKKIKMGIMPIEEKNGDDLLAFNEERYRYLSENEQQGGVSVDVLINHIDYIVKLVGADYVGLGSDFDGGIRTPNELYDATCYPIITKKLVERGYTEQEIRKILGLNFIRVFKKVCP